jgi:ribonuclease P protein component
MVERARTSDAAPFTAAHRLRHKEQFDLVYREGRRLSDSNFQIVSHSNSTPHARLGLSVPSKTIGNAVNRNRVKRVVRESFRLNVHRLPCVDVVVNARPGAKSAVNEALAHSLEQLWDKLARHA